MLACSVPTFKPYMRIQIASDLHLESLKRRFPGFLPVTPAQADVLVLAGDIATGCEGVEMFADWPVPVIYVHGNHESYGTPYEDLPRKIRASAKGTAVNYLENEALVIDNVRFLGCCLWTDYNLYDSPVQGMETALEYMHDYTEIATEAGGWFTPEHALVEHKRSVRWLRDQLAIPFSGKTVVVTHHGVAPLSVHPRFKGNPINAAFVSDLSALLPLADIFIHGHVHDSVDYRIGRTRVLTNPRGYATNLNQATCPQSLAWENNAFKDDMVVRIDDRQVLASV